MSTRSHIGIRNTDGTVDYIYCHYDGYPSGVGETLTKHYTTYDKVKALIALGDLSALGAEIGEKQDFNDRSTQNEDWCLAYGRDRGESNTEFRTDSYLNMISDDNVSYAYVFDGDYWECFDTSYPEENIRLY